MMGKNMFFFPIHQKHPIWLVRGYKESIGAMNPTRELYERKLIEPSCEINYFLVSLCCCSFGD